MKEQIRQIVGLLATMTEGLDYVETKLQAYDLTNSTGVMRDSIGAFLTIQQALTTMPGLIKKGRQQQSITQKSEKLQESFPQVVTAWEEGDATKTNAFYQAGVLPAVVGWKKGLEKILLPLVQM